ncbi:MAG: hypothetical protein ACR2KX_12255 [Chitinophagaceae bacterium]
MQNTAIAICILVLQHEIYKALTMNDYKGAPYAEWIKTGEKTIETRHRTFNYRGDIFTCCVKTNSVGKNAGNYFIKILLFYLSRLSYSKFI